MRIADLEIKKIVVGYSDASAIENVYNGDKRSHSNKIG
jgi:hypothetical protein